MGYNIEPQVGSAGFYIDIAVKDPGKPGRFILAVECDGASYHSSATARDRDRLRQTVLESLGWRFHRIWSTDWYRNKKHEIDRLKEAIELSVRFYEELDKENNPFPSEHKKQEKRTIARREGDSLQNTLKADEIYNTFSDSLGLNPYSDITFLNYETIIEAIRLLISEEGPLHITVAAKRLANSARFARVGQKMFDHIHEAVIHDNHTKQLYFEENFIYGDGNKFVPIRDRSHLSGSEKKIELIPSSEIKKAITKVVANAFSINEREIISSALSLLGFKKTTETSKQVLQKIIREMIEQNELITGNGKITVPELKRV